MPLSCSCSQLPDTSVETNKDYGIKSPASFRTRSLVSTHTNRAFNVSDQAIRKLPAKLRLQAKKFISFKRNRGGLLRKRPSSAGDDFAANCLHCVAKPAMGGIGVQSGMPHGGNGDFRCFHGKAEQSQAGYCCGIIGEVCET